MSKKISELPAATVPLAGTEKLEIIQGGINKQVDASQVGAEVIHYIGDYAGTTTFPSTGGTFTGGVPGAGDRWRLTNTLVVGGNVYGPGTIIEAAINTPGNTRANWNIYAMQL